MTQSEEFAKMRKDVEAIKRASKKTNESMTSYVKALNDAAVLNRQIKDQQKKLNQLEKKRLKMISEGATANDAELIALEKKIAFHKEEIDLYQQSINKLKEAIKLQKALGNEVKKLANKGYKRVVKEVRDLPRYFTEQDKAIRQATLSMGLMGDQSSELFKHINKSAISTNRMGVDMKGLAKLQQSYSEKVGKTIVLSTKGLNAMAELQQGAFMGDDGMVAEYAASMENFGVSVTDARNTMEEGVNLSMTMGVNASKYSQDMVKNLKLAQGYNFKGGTANLKKMTALAIKFKLSMESVAGVADKLITPEGAVEMAASLQVLGGAWSKLADPFTLMYQARHDMEGLQESIIKATAGTAQFNKETQEFDISGMEMHRLREVAEKLGMDYKELSESAKAFAKDAKIKTMIDPKIGKDAREFIGSNGIFNKDSQKWEIEVVGADGGYMTKEIKDVDVAMMKATIANKKTLEERALGATTFNETLTNLINSLKTTLIPFLKGVEKVLKPVVEGLIGTLTDEDGVLVKVAGNLSEAGESFGNFLVGFKDVFSHVAENWGTYLTSALVGVGLFKAAQWIFNGKMLRMGFNMGGPMGGGGAMGGGGGAMGPTSKINPATGGRQYNFKQYQPSTPKGGMMGGMGRTAGGMAGMAIGTGANLWRSSMEDQNSTGAQALGVLGSTAQYAGMGAMMGGPWGALAGGVLGAGIGVYDNVQRSNAAYKKATTAQGAVVDPKIAYERTKQTRDVILRPDGSSYETSSKDTIAALDMEKATRENKSSNNSSNTTNHTFDDIVFKGEINIKSPNGDSYDFMKDLKANANFKKMFTDMVTEQIIKETSGGKLRG